MVVRYPYPAKAETDVRCESVYPLQATFRAKRRGSGDVTPRMEMIFRRSSVDQSEAATAPETTSEPKGAAKEFRIWVIAGSSILLGVVLSVAVALAIQSTMTVY